MPPKHPNLKKRNAALAELQDEATAHTKKQTRLARHSIITDTGIQTKSFVLPASLPHLVQVQRSADGSMPQPAENTPQAETTSTSPDEEPPKKKTQVGFILWRPL